MIIRDKKITLHKYKGDKIAEKEIGKIKDDMIVIKFESLEKFKTYKQIKTIHSLLTAFLNSGFSSAPDWVTSVENDRMRNEYFKAWFKSEYIGYYEKTIKVINGEPKEDYEIKSFSKYSKTEMRRTIDKILQLINDSGANHYHEIVKIINGLEQEKESLQQHLRR